MVWKNFRQKRPTYLMQMKQTNTPFWTEKNRLTWLDAHDGLSDATSVVVQMLKLNIEFPLKHRQECSNTLPFNSCGNPRTQPSSNFGLLIVRTHKSKTRRIFCGETTVTCYGCEKTHRKPTDLDGISNTNVFWCHHQGRWVCRWFLSLPK